MTTTTSYAAALWAEAPGMRDERFEDDFEFEARDEDEARRHARKLLLAAPAMCRFATVLRLDEHGISICTAVLDRAAEEKAPDRVREALLACWWFIENVNDDTPDRTDRFFALREQVRGALDAEGAR